jgi:hypothetical protein
MTLNLAALVAAHEAGHAVVAWAFGFEVVEVSAVPIPGGSYVRWWSLRNAHSEETVDWGSAVITIGGIAGQFKCGVPARGAEVADDLYRARRSIEALLIKRLDFAMIIHHDTTRLNQLSRMFHDPPTGAVRHLLESAYVDARATLARFHDEFLALQLALLLFKRLDAWEFRFLLGSSRHSSLWSRFCLRVRLILALFVFPLRWWLCLHRTT